MTTHRDQLLELLLVPGAGDLVVATLAVNISMAFRGVRLEAKDAQSEVESMRVANEIMHVLAKQALHYKGVRDVGYPEDALMQVLGELAEKGHLEVEWKWSCERTVAACLTVRANH